MKKYLIVGSSKSGNPGEWTVKLEDDEKIEDAYSYKSLLSVDKVVCLGEVSERKFVITGTFSPLIHNGRIIDEAYDGQATTILEDDEKIEDSKEFKGFSKIDDITELSDDAVCENTYIAVIRGLAIREESVQANSIKEAYLKVIISLSGYDKIEHISMTDKNNIALNDIIDQEELLYEMDATNSDEITVKEGGMSAVVVSTYSREQIETALERERNLRIRGKDECKFMGLTTKLIMTCAYIQQVANSQKGIAVDYVKNKLNNLLKPLNKMTVDERCLLDIELINHLSK